MPGPQQGLGREDDDLLRGLGVGGQGVHVEVGDHRAEEVHAVVEGRRDQHFRAVGRLLHVAAQRARVLLGVLVEYGVEVEGLGLAAGSGLLAEHGAVGLDAGKAVDPGAAGEEVLHPAARRRLVGVEHDALEPLQLHVGAHHAVGQGLAPLGEHSLVVVVDAGRRADVFVPEALGALPDVLRGLPLGAACAHAQRCHQAGKQQALAYRCRQNTTPYKR